MQPQEPRWRRRGPVVLTVDSFCVMIMFRPIIVLEFVSSLCAEHGHVWIEASRRHRFNHKLLPSQQSRQYLI
jgi:hypothetical protein